MKHLAISITTASLLLFNACKSSTEEDALNHEDHDHEHGQPITVDSTSLRDFEVGYCTAQPFQLRDSIQTRGTIEAPPQSMFDISTPYGGEITEMKYYEGAFVNKGTVIAKLRHLNYVSLQEEYLELIAAERENTKALNRQQTLREEGSTSEKVYEEVLAANATFKVKRQGLEVRLKMSGMSPEAIIAQGIAEEVLLKAPVTGYITKAHGNIGTFIAPNMPIYSMVDPSHLHIELSLYQEHAGKVAQGQKVKFAFGGSERAMEAEVFLVSQHVETQKNTVNVHAHPAEGIQGMMPGMFVSATIITKSREVLALPTGSAVQIEGKWLGLASAGDNFEVITFADSMVTEGRRVLLAANDERQFICKNLDRALATLVSSENQADRHSH